MKGLITEKDLTIADQEFPGIAQLWATLEVEHKEPETFLNLIVVWEHRQNDNNKGENMQHN